MAPRRLLRTEKAPAPSGACDDVGHGSRRLPSGLRLTFESRQGFRAGSRRASLRHAHWDFHFRHGRRRG